MRGILKSLPVLMYHYISRYPNSISVSPELFEEHCAALARAGWRGVSLAEAEAFLAEGAPLPPKSALITFDDGYLDNYVYAWPILRKYGHCGVVFAVCERLEPGGPARSTLEDLWAGRVGAEDLPKVDEPVKPNALGHKERLDLFLNWEEARLMEKSGVMAVAAHSMGHLGVFNGPEYQGFYEPGHQVRTFYRSLHPIIWGLPKFKQKSALAERAFVPNPSLAEAIKKLVPQNYAGAVEFFRRESGRRELQALLASFAGNLGAYESEAERSARLAGEMLACRDILTRELGHAVNSFCWPWGTYCRAALEAGQEAGFRVFYTVKSGANQPGSPLAVRRFKAKSKSGAWLLSRVRLYSSPFWGNLYSRFHA